MGPVSKHARQEIAERIRQAVEISGLSREYICKTVGIDPSRLSKWENAYNTPGSLHMAKLVQVVNVDGHWLLTGEGSPHPKERGEAARLEAVRLISTGEVSTPTVSAVLKQLQKAQALARLEESARSRASVNGVEE